MATYIMLANWTDQGARSVKDSPRRLDAARKLLNEIGGDFKSFFLAMGNYDVVAILKPLSSAASAARH
jgi:uncharacterized protein with GYD domain